MSITAEATQLQFVAGLPSERAELLGRITAAIAEAVTPEQVYEALVDRVAQAFGASSAGLWILDKDGRTAQLVRSMGYNDAARLAVAHLHLDQPLRLPALDAILDGRPLLLSSRAEMLERYPHLSSITNNTRSYRVACIPLVVDGRTLGSFGFTFEQSASEVHDRSEFLSTAARYSAQALERLRLLEVEKHSRSEAEALAYRLGLLSRASKTFAEVAPDTHTLLQAVVELVCADFADGCGVNLLGDGDMLPVAASHHRDPTAAEMLRRTSTDSGFRVGVGLTGRVAETGQAIVMPSVDSAQLVTAAHPDMRSFVERFAPKSIAAVPMRARGRVIGVLTAGRDAEGRAFSDSDVILLEDLAERAAMAIENGRLHQDNQRGRARAEVLYALAGTVNQAATLDEVCTSALSALDQAMGAWRSSILILDTDGIMRFRAWRGLSDDYRAAVEGHSPWSRHTQAPLPILIADVGQDPSMASYLPVFQKEGIRALGFIPLVAGGVLLGKFMVYFNEPHVFAAVDREMAIVIAHHVAAAIARFSTIEELQRTVHFNEMFTAMLGHDLRNPLSGIITAAEVLLNREDSAAFRKPLARIVGSGARMSRMIDQLLDFTRVRVGTGIPVRRRTCKLPDVVSEVTDELKGTFPDRQVTLQATGECQGDWDSDRLAQIFSNLIANAMTHGTPGTPVVVAVDGSAPGGVKVTVSNAGTIAASILPRLFEPMAGSDRRSDKSAGLGLGLYISRQIARAHGGDITATSDAQQGTTFMVTLPRVVGGGG